MTSKTDTYYYPLEIGGHEYEARAAYTYVGPIKGGKDRHGMQVEPDEPAYVEIHKIDVYSEAGTWLPFPYLRRVWEDVKHDIIVTEAS